MISALPINNRCQIFSCWLAARCGQARINSLIAPPALPVVTPLNLQRARLRQLAHSHCAPKPSLHPPHARLASPTPVPKSP